MYILYIIVLKIKLITNLHALSVAIHVPPNNNSKVIAEAFIYPYPITGLYIGTVAFTFHKTAATLGLEMKPTLTATRNETGRNNYQTLPIVIRTEH